MLFNGGSEWTVNDVYYSFAERAADPNTPEANQLRLYSKDKAGVSNLYFKDDAGVVHDLSAGAMAIGATVTSGTVGSVLFIGSGPVLAQDNANLFWDDTNNRLGIGHTAPETLLDVASLITTIARGIRSNQFSNDAVSANLNCAKSRGTTVGSQVAVTTDDILGNIGFQGSDGSSFGVTQANILCFAAEAWTGSAKGTYLVFRTTPKASTTVAERFRIDDKGNVIVNTAALATNATDGFLYIPTSAGTPTGTPTTYTGRVAMEYDTTNNKLYVYNGAWKSVTLA